MSSADALDLANYLTAHCFDKNPEGTAWDLLMHDWARDRWPGINHFVASVPALVQHIGMNSIVNPRDNIHTFPSFKGGSWTFVDKSEKLVPGGIYQQESDHE